MARYDYDGKLPWHQTDAGKRFIATYQAKRREAWKIAGLCIDCGKSRKFPTLRCESCLVGNADRSNRSYHRKRMAKRSWVPLG